MSEAPDIQPPRPVGRLLTWPIAALAGGVCLLAGLVIGFLVGRRRHEAPPPVARPAGGLAGLPPVVLPEPEDPPVRPPAHPSRHRFAAEVIWARQQIFARRKEQLFAAPPHQLYCLVQVRLALLTDEPVNVPLTGGDVALVTDSGLRFACLGVMTRTFDWTSPDALTAPAAGQTVRLDPKSSEPVTPRLLFLLPQGARPFTLNVRGARAARIGPETIETLVSDLDLTEGSYRRDELGAFRVAGAPPLAKAMDHSKAAYEMIVRREEDLWNLQFPALHVVGWLVPGGTGHYSGVLEDDGGEKLEISARMMAGGHAVLLYLTDDPHGSLLFRRRPSTQPADASAAPETAPISP